MAVRRPSPAMAVAGLALFVSLSGTSYAVSQLPKNSVGSAQIKPGAVGSSDLARGAVTKEKLAADVVGAGPRGPRGEQGPAGAQGAAGANALPKTAYVHRSPGLIPALPSTSNAARQAVVELRLPAGSYTLAFSAHAYQLATDVTFIYCHMDGPSGGLTGVTSALGPASGAPRNAQQAALAMHEAVTLAAPATVKVVCSTVAGISDAYVADGRLVATPVGAVEVQ